MGLCAPDPRLCKHLDAVRPDTLALQGLHRLLKHRGPPPRDHHRRPVQPCAAPHRCPRSAVHTQRHQKRARKLSCMKFYVAICGSRKPADMSPRKLVSWHAPSIVSQGRVKRTQLSGDFESNTGASAGDEGHLQSYMRRQRQSCVLLKLSE